MKSTACIFLSTLMILSVSMFNSFAQESGQTLFKQNCGACHTVTKRTTVGPGLEGISEKRSKEWLLKWIKDSQSLVKSGDADAIKIFEEYGKNVMPPISLNEAQISSILDFIKNPDSAKPSPDLAINEEVVVPEAPLSTGVKLLVFGLILMTAIILIYVCFLMRRLRQYGIMTDTIPLRDRLSDWASNNSLLIILVSVGFILFILSSLMKEWI